MTDLCESTVLLELVLDEGFAESVERDLFGFVRVVIICRRFWI